MFCSSLRNRSKWCLAPDILLSHTSQGIKQWKETSLDTHDLAVPIPNVSSTSEQDFFRFLLLSVTDMQIPETAMARIERLYHLVGGRTVGIVFLIQDAASREDGVRAVMDLQIRLLPSFELPVLPLHSVASLNQTVQALQKQLLVSRAAPIPRIDPAIALLPYCSNTPLSDHTRNVLSDICHSIPEVAQAATTIDGQEELNGWLAGDDPSVVGNIISFWENEFMAD